MIHVLANTNPRARKRHQCHWCGDQIEIGEKHSAQKCVDNGSAYTVRMHAECDEAFKEYWKGLESWEQYGEDPIHEECGMVRGKPWSKDYEPKRGQGE